MVMPVFVGKSFFQGNDSTDLDTVQILIEMERLNGIDPFNGSALQNLVLAGYLKLFQNLRLIGRGYSMSAPPSVQDGVLPCVASSGRTVSVLCPSTLLVPSNGRASQSITQANVQRAIAGVNEQG